MPHDESTETGRGFVCRRLSDDEISAAAQVIFESFNDFSDKSGTARIPDVDTVGARLREYASDSGIPGMLYGGFEDGALVGAMMLRKLGIDEEAWEISMLSILPARQGKGSGGKMVAFALGQILNLKGVLAVCAVTEGNDRALRLFARYGFESEASGVPVSEDMSIWMLRRDMANRAAAEAVAQELASDTAREAEELSGFHPLIIDAAEPESSFEQQDR